MSDPVADPPLPWHWAMLNDVRRNEVHIIYTFSSSSTVTRTINVYCKAYSNAIKRAIRDHKPQSALDIGAGAGLLTLLLGSLDMPEQERSLLSLERIYACEIMPGSIVSSNNIVEFSWGLHAPNAGLAAIAQVSWRENRGEEATESNPGRPEKRPTKLELFALHSAALKVPETLPSKVDLIVTETVDETFFGEAK